MKRVWTAEELAAERLRCNTPHPFDCTPGTRRCALCGHLGDDWRHEGAAAVAPPVAGFVGALL